MVKAALSEAGIENDPAVEAAREAAQAARESAKEAMHAAREAAAEEFGDVRSTVREALGDTFREQRREHRPRPNK